MKKKLLSTYFIIALFFPIEIFSQTSMLVKDAYGIVVKSSTNDSITYVTKSGKEIGFPFPLNVVSYKGGIKKLKKGILKNVHSINGEFNIRTLFYVLFDENLHIKEVRAIDVIPKLGNWKELSEEYVSFIYKTEGKWKKKQKGREWYIYVFSMSIN